MIEEKIRRAEVEHRERLHLEKLADLEKIQQEVFGCFEEECRQDKLASDE